jgi:pyridinium-3,5-bisthiocarboxylic acid mononucleotide nickel chelatase
MGEGHGHHQNDAHHEPKAALAQGSGSGRLLHFDAFSGIAGDMTIAALLDLGVPRTVVEGAVRLLPIHGYHLHVGEARPSGIRATTFDVHVEAEQPERTHAEIDAMIVASALAPPVRAMARATFLCLGEAEAEVHGIPLEAVHFHEVGAVDAIVDIVGAAAAIVWLGAEVNVSPLPMGHGLTTARHGVLPLPAPATVAILRGVPTYGVDVEAELVTPTGAAIAKTAARTFERWPAMVPERVGWGAGAREIAGRPNVLRAVLATRTAAASEPDFVVIEANVDDLTGELAAHAIAVLLAEGALDAWATPNVMKKGRPGLTLAVLGRREQEDALAATLLRTTSTIGVRRHTVSRTERPREIVTVDTPFGAIPVKISRGPFGPPLVKPEFDACADAARAAGVGVRDVIAAAMDAARGL